jgi:threonyl-tRNA synthetase
MGKKFELEYTAKDGTKKTPAVIHRAPLGTHERFIGFLIEHFAGAFPLWLSPVQVKVIPVRDTHNDAASAASAALKKAGLRVDLDMSDTGFGKKVREAKDFRVPYTIIIGDQDLAAGVVTLESRDKGKVGSLKIEEVVNMLAEENKGKK